MKNISFTKRAIILIWCMYILLLIIGCVYLSLQIERRHMDVTVTMQIIVIPFLLYAGLYIIIMKWFMKPYVTYKRMFHRFVDGQVYQEVLDKSPLFMQELGEVIYRFNELVDWNKTIQLSTKQAEFLALQNQINPHFLYNTLDAIRGDALCAGMENVADITEALSTFFRYTITETGNLVTLMDELSNVEDYFTIQQYRFGEKLKLKVVMDDDSGQIMQFQCPKLMLQPIVENAIFHGLEKKTEGGTVSIKFGHTKDRVIINIHDDGVGMEEEAMNKINQKLSHVSMKNIQDEKKKKGGIALNNVCKRIKLLFGEEYGIHVFSLANYGTTVSITLPVIHRKTERYDEKRNFQC